MSGAAADPREGVRGMQEIVKGVLTWSWLSEPHGYNFNGHMVRHAGGNICIDPVETEDTVLHRLRTEEHTSELQSLMRISYAVYGMKKQTNKRNQYNT